MKINLLAILLMCIVVAQAFEIEEANLSKNWTTTQNNPWLYQYFQANGTRINMTQSCTGTTSSQYQCWKAGVESDQTATSLYPLTYNLTAMVGSGGGVVFPNLAYKYFFTKALGNYTMNISFYCANGFCGTGDGMNYTIRKDSSVICSGTFTTTAGLQTKSCIIGNLITAGSSTELAIGANTGSSADYGNFSMVVYQVYNTRFLMQVKDEATLNNILYSVTISNETNTTTYPASSAIWFNKTHAEIPTGNLTISLTNTSFYTRSYQMFYNENSTTLNFTGYMLNTSNPYAHLVSLTVKDTAGVPIEAAYIQVQKLISNIYTDVGTAYTDSTGTSSFFMDATTQYYIIISKPGYTNNTGTLVPASNQYTYTLSSTSGGGGYSGLFTDTTYSMSPQSLSNYTIAITGTTSTTSALAYTALRLTLGNGTQIFYSNDTTASGASISSNVDATGWNNTNITAVLQIKKDGLAEFNYTRYYFIYNFTAFESNASLTGLFRNLQAANMSKASQYIIASSTGLIIASGAWLVSGPVGAGLLFVAVESFWAQAGWVDWNLVYLLGLLALALIMMNRF